MLAFLQIGVHIGVITATDGKRNLLKLKSKYFKKDEKV